MKNGVPNKLANYTPMSLHDVRQSAQVTVKDFNHFRRIAPHGHGGITTDVAKHDRHLAQLATYRTRPAISSSAT